MSIGPQPELVAEGTIPLAPWAKLLPPLALFVRLAVGLALLNLGLAAVTAAQANPFGGAPGWSSRGLPPWLAGLAVIFDLLPYGAVAAGVGLVFGIFTTASALIACALTLVFPVLLTFGLVVAGGAVGGPSMMAFGRNEGLVISSLVGLAAVPTLVALVLLSPVAINRFSIDALIFQRAAPLPPPQPGATGVVDATDAAGAGPDQLASV